MKNLFLLLIIGTTMACSSSQKTSGSRDDKCTIKSIERNKVNFLAYRNAVYDEFMIVNDELVIQIKNTFLNAEDYVLYWDGGMAKSLPPKLKMRFIQKNKDTSRSTHKDLCLKYDITQLKTSSGNSVILILNRDGEIEYPY